MDGWMPEETLRKLHGDGGACFMAPIECASTGKIPLKGCAFFFLIGNPLRNSCTNFGFPEASLRSEVNSVLVITSAVEISVLCHRILSLIHQPYT